MWVREAIAGSGVRVTELIRRTDAATLTMIDGLVIFWLVLWSVVGAWVGFSLWELSALGGTLVESGRTLDSVGQALQRAGDLPLIGAWPAELGDQVRATAAEIIARGEQSAAYGRQVSVLLAITVAVVPVLPVLVPYLPARVGRRRDVKAVARALQNPAQRRALEFYLAQRAVCLVPLRRLIPVTDDPWRDMAEGRLQTLADAELARLGLSGDAGVAGRR